MYICIVQREYKCDSKFNYFIQWRLWESPLKLIFQFQERRKESRVQTNSRAMLNKCYEVYWGRKNCICLGSLREMSWKWRLNPRLNPVWDLSRQRRHGRGRKPEYVFSWSSQATCLVSKKRNVRECSKFRNVGGCQAKAQVDWSLTRGWHLHSCVLETQMDSSVSGGLVRRKTRGESLGKRLWRS